MKIETANNTEIRTAEQGRVLAFMSGNTLQVTTKMYVKKASNINVLEFESEDAAYEHFNVTKPE